MNGNRSPEKGCRLTALAVVAAFCAFASPSSSVQAQQPAPPPSAGALSGVKEIVLQHVRFGKKEPSETCGLMKGDLLKELVYLVKQSSVPVFPVLDAKLPLPGVARIDLLPEVVTLSGYGFDCVSWVSLTAQSRNLVKIPPVETARNVTVTYWRNGVLVASGSAFHARSVIDALRYLGGQFADQYKADQPPILPTLTGEEE